MSGTIASFYYQLGLTGNRTNLSETVNSTSRSYQWQYDRLYRLTNEVVSGLGTLGYGYDPVGNRTNRTSTISGLGAQTPAYNTNDWLMTDSYDSNGNTIASGGNTYQYDALNHVTNVNSGAIIMTYDGDGNRVSKTAGGVTTYYLMDDRNPSGYAQVLEEYQGSALNKVYNYGLGLISQKQGSTFYDFIFDGHGSTRILTDGNGTVQNAFAYDVYGNLIVSNGVAQTVYLYCGQQLDPNLGLYYNRARYLNAGTGRFWTMDSYNGNNQDPLSLHKYLYGADNPANGIDPSGHDTLGAVLTGIAIGVAIDAFVMYPEIRAYNHIAQNYEAIIYPNEVRIWIGHNSSILHYVGANGPAQSRLTNPDPRLKNHSDDVFLACGAGTSGSALSNLTDQDDHGGPPFISSLDEPVFQAAENPDSVGYQGEDDRLVIGFLSATFGPDPDHNTWSRRIPIPMSYYLDGTIKYARKRATEIGATHIRFILLGGHSIFLNPGLNVVGPDNQLTGQAITDDYLLNVH